MDAKRNDMDDAMRTELALVCIWALEQLAEIRDEEAEKALKIKAKYRRKRKTMDAAIAAGNEGA